MYSVKKIKDINREVGKAALYEFNKPVKYKILDYDNDGNELLVEQEIKYVFVSSSVVAAETAIFPADKNGRVTDWHILWNEEIVNVEQTINNYVNYLNERK